MNHIPAEMFVIARKLRHVEQLMTPQQSAYEAAWDEAPKAAKAGKSFARHVKGVIRSVAPGMANVIRSYQRKRRLAGKSAELFRAPDFIFVGNLFDRIK